MAGAIGRKAEDDWVSRVVKEEVKKLNLMVGGNTDKKVKCQTCTYTQKQIYVCLGKKCTKCIDCGESGHFKGAPICNQSKKAKPQKEDLNRHGIDISSMPKGIYKSHSSL